MGKVKNFGKIIAKKMYIEKLTDDEIVKIVVQEQQVPITQWGEIRRATEAIRNNPQVWIPIANQIE